MKLLQAIVTSSVETLDGRQGFGLVACSRSMPDPIKKQAREWESPSNGNREPVYSYKLVNDAGSNWAVMNRTIPATDYTGRTSHVSHTVAISVEELRELFRQRSGEVITPSEFMLSFQWKSSWNETPHWIEEAEDVNSANTLTPRSEEVPPFDWHPAAALLAFQIDDIEIPKPKRLAWKSGNLTSEGILCLFHSAWLALDPWRGRRDYGDHLGEPSASLMDSWECTWTTDLRDERPDDYQWIILTPGTSNLVNREVIDVTEWKAMDEETIAQLIGAPGRLLVVRSKAPEEWAQGEICRRVEELELNRNTALESCRSELRSSTKDVFLEAEELYSKKTKESHQWEPYLRSIDNTGTISNQTEYLTKLRSRFESIVSEFRIKTTDADQIHDGWIKSLLALRKSSNGACANWEIAHSSELNFEELQNQFNALEEKLRSTLFYLSASQIAHHFADKSGNLEKQQSEIKKELSAQTKISESLNKELLQKNEKSSVSPRKHGALKPQSFPWLLVSSVVVVVLVVSIALTWFLGDRINIFGGKPNRSIFEEPQKKNVEPMFKLNEPSPNEELADLKKKSVEDANKIDRLNKTITEAEAQKENNTTENATLVNTLKEELKESTENWYKYADEVAKLKKELADLKSSQPTPNPQANPPKIKVSQGPIPPKETSRGSTPAQP